MAATVAPAQISEASRLNAGAAGALTQTCLVIVEVPHGLETVSDTVYVPGAVYW